MDAKQHANVAKREILAALPHARVIVYTIHQERAYTTESYPGIKVAGITPDEYFDIVTPICVAHDTPRGFFDLGDHRQRTYTPAR